MSAELAAPGRSRRVVLRVFLLVLVPLLAALVGAYLYLKGGHGVETDNAYVKADKIPVSTELAGKVKAVFVNDNQVVKQGQLLFRLDDAALQVAIAKAQARVALVRTDLAVMRAGYRQKQAEIRLAQSKYEFALRDQQRQADLIAKNFISAAKFDDAKQNSDLARQQVLALELDLKRLAETLGGSVDAPVERHASFLAAQAELDQAKLDLSHIDVYAPAAGTVSKPPKPGQFLGAGATAMALVAGNELWIEANFSETDLTYVRIGQPVRVEIDTFPDYVWQGEVESLSPATGAEFSILPAQNATGNWVKIAQRVAVRIRIRPLPEQSKAAPPLRAGLSAVVKIDTGQKRHLFGWSL